MQAVKDKASGVAGGWTEKESHLISLIQQQTDSVVVAAASRAATDATHAAVRAAALQGELIKQLATDKRHTATAASAAHNATLAAADAAAKAPGGVARAPVVKGKPKPIKTGRVVKKAPSIQE